MKNVNSKLSFLRGVRYSVLVYNNGLEGAYIVNLLPLTVIEIWSICRLATKIVAMCSATKFVATAHLSIRVTRKPRFLGKKNECQHPITVVLTDMQR
jgi:hypothetical protein